jgi:cytochrome c-type biogenesis protein CcmE
MTRKRRRLWAVLAGMGALGIAAGLVLTAMRDNLVFFYSPTELATRAAPLERQLRIGGLVEESSVVRAADGKSVVFRVTDRANTVAVAYKGSLPDLFREGQGVVAEGVLQRDGVFRASSVLAKHDENYMPPEVADALKKSGRWRDGAAGAISSVPQ